jgi:hypothetical protein
LISATQPLPHAQSGAARSICTMIGTFQALLVAMVAVKRATKAVVRWFTDQAPEPRAWYMAFSRPNLTGWVRIKLKDGTWRAGPWNRTPGTSYPSYASGYPEPQELYLSDQAVINDAGGFVTETGEPQLTGWSLLISWDEITVLELLEDRGDDTTPLAEGVS